MQAFSTFAQQGGQLCVTQGLNSTTEIEQSYPSCTVTVYLTGTTTLATLFANNNLIPTPLSNPFTANVNGQFLFYAANNRYDVVLSNNGASGPTNPITISDILLNDPSGGSGSVTSVFGRNGAVVAQPGDYAVAQITGAAPLASPALTGVATSPTPSPGDNTTKIATTAFVTAAVAAAASAVTSVFGRTGVVVATTGDYTVAQVTGAAALASPTFTGTPLAPTASPGTNTTQLATTAFVQAALPSAGVTSFNTRTGAVVPATADYTVSQVTGAAPLASPTFTGVPSGPTAAQGTSTTQLATTQFVQQAGNSPVLFALVSLTSAQLLALNTTPITLVPAPGAGVAIAIFAIYMEYKYNSVVYTINGATLQFDYNNAGSALKTTFAETGFFDQASSQLALIAPATVHGALTVAANQPYTLGATGGSNMTLGNGTAGLFVYYTLVNLL